MPIVPKYNSPQAEPSSLPQPRMTAPEFHNYAADQVKQLGGAEMNLGGHVAEIALDIQNEANKTAAKDIDTQATASIGGVLYDPKSGFLSKQGKDAVVGYDDARKAVDKIRQQSLENIQNPAVRQMVEPVITARTQHAFETIDRHSGAESRRYQVQTSDARAIVTLQDAAQNFEDDNRFHEALAVSREETATLAKLQGWDENTARLQVQKYTDTGYQMRYDAWAVKDPLAAFAHFQHNGEQVSPQIGDNIGRQLFQRAAPLLANYLNQSGSTPRKDTAATGLKMIDDLPADWRQHVFQLARSQAHQAMAEVRESLRGRVQDASAEYMANGFASNPPNKGEFIRAYGQDEGASRYHDFQNTAQLGQTLQQVRTLPAAALNDLLQSSKPAPGDGFAVRQHNYQILAHAVDTVMQARSEDPVAYALTSRSYGIQPLQRVDDPKALAEELARRSAAAGQMSSDYGTPPRLLSNPESKSLAATLRAMPVEAQKTHLAAIYKGVNNPELFKRTMQAIAPDSPTVAVAGMYQGRGLRSSENRDVADLILRGQEILTPNSKEDGSGHMGGKSLVPMPEEKLLLSEWNATTGDAFKGKEQSADLFQQTARAIYAAKSSEDGDYSGIINAKRWKAAIELATGGLADYNGSRIVMPYGMKLDTFRDEVKSNTEELAKSSKPVAANADDLRRLPLENVGDGRYLFRRGAGYVVGQDGKPLILNITGARR